MIQQLTTWWCCKSLGGLFQWQTLAPWVPPQCFKGQIRATVQCNSSNSPRMKLPLGRTLQCTQKQTLATLQEEPDTFSMGSKGAAQAKWAVSYGSKANRQLQLLQFLLPVVLPLVCCRRGPDRLSNTTGGLVQQVLGEVEDGGDSRGCVVDLCIFAFQAKL